LSQVARNAAIDTISSRKKKESVETPEENNAPIRAMNGSPDQVAEQRSEIKTLLTSLSGLPEQQRSALVMREVGGYSCDEIASTLGVNTQAVHGLIKRARLSLKATQSSSDMACSIVRDQLASESDGRNRRSEIRRHLKTCSDCKKFSEALKQDRKALRALTPPVGIGLIIKGVFSGSASAAQSSSSNGLIHGSVSTAKKIAAVGGIGVASTAAIIGGVATVRTNDRPQKPSSNSSIGSAVLVSSKPNSNKASSLALTLEGKQRSLESSKSKLKNDSADPSTPVFSAPESLIPDSSPLPTQPTGRDSSGDTPSQQIKPISDSDITVKKPEDDLSLSLPSSDPSSGEGSDPGSGSGEDPTTTTPGTTDPSEGGTTGGDTPGSDGKDPDKKKEKKADPKAGLPEDGGFTPTPTPEPPAVDDPEPFVPTPPEGDAPCVPGEDPLDPTCIMP